MLQQPTILIVEDVLPNHELFRKAFTDAGFKTIISQNADGDFLADIVALKPDIISMDLLIGKEGVQLQRDGFQTIELIKNDDRTKHIPIIVMSNFFEDGKVRKAKELGVVDFINLQGHALANVPNIFKNYLKNPRHYLPTHPIFREK